MRDFKDTHKWHEEHGRRSAIAPKPSPSVPPKKRPVKACTCSTPSQCFCLLVINSFPIVVVVTAMPHQLSGALECRQHFLVLYSLHRLNLANQIHRVWTIRIQSGKWHNLQNGGTPQDTATTPAAKGADAPVSTPRTEDSNLSSADRFSMRDVEGVATVTPATRITRLVLTSTQVQRSVGFQDCMGCSCVMLASLPHHAFIFLVVC